MRTTFAVVVLCLAVAQVIAQEDAPAGFVMKVEGDSTEKFKVSCELAKPHDQSSPEALVDSWIRITDSRPANQQAEDAVLGRWIDAVNKAIDADAKTLLTEDAFKHLVEGRRLEAERNAEQARNRKQNPPVTTRLATTVENGVTRIRVQQTVKWTWNEEVGTETTLYRLTCTKGNDGKWRISELAIAERGADDEDEAKVDYEATVPPVLTSLYMLRRRAECTYKLATVRQDTPESAARTLLEGLLPRREKLVLEGHARNFAGLMRLHEELYTADFTGETKKKVELYYPLKEQPDHSLVEPMVSVEENIHTVWFKVMYAGSTNLMRAIAVKLKKVGEVWMVTEAGVSEEYGEFVGYQRVSDIYELIRNAG
ncbi:MAG: hypothetical protein KF696_09300 [Planctomycetes bacterium]|nr:hypothetical protein [Planctomycetota bacterium]MCW8136782.1 hypothetical protein [Planctomycetota bacterium]